MMLLFLLCFKFLQRFLRQWPLRKDIVFNVISIWEFFLQLRDVRVNLFLLFLSSDWSIWPWGRWPHLPSIRIDVYHHSLLIACLASWTHWPPGILLLQCFIVLTFNLTTSLLYLIFDRITQFDILLGCWVLLDVDVIRCWFCDLDFLLTSLFITAGFNCLLLDLLSIWIVLILSLHCDCWEAVDPFLFFMPWLCVEPVNSQLCDQHKQLLVLAPWTVLVDFFYVICIATA